MAAAVSMIGQSVRAADYNWSTLSGGSLDWTNPVNWGGAGSPSGSGDRANLSVPLAGSLIANVPGAGVTTGTVILGGTAGVVTTDVAGGILTLNSRIISQGSAGAINIISAPLRFTGNPTIVATNNLLLSGNISQGTGAARTITADLTSGQTLTIGATPGSSSIDLFDEASPSTGRTLTIFMADNSTGTLVLNAVFNPGTSTGTGYILGPANNNAINATFKLAATQTTTRNGQIHRQRYIAAADNAFGLGVVTTSNSNNANQWGQRIESDNDARFLSNAFLIGNPLLITGSNSLTLKNYATIGNNNRPLANNLVAGKTLTMEGAGAGTLAGVAIGLSNAVGDGNRVWRFDGPGRTVVSGKIVNNIAEYAAGSASIVGGILKLGSGTVELNNALNANSGSIQASGGLLVFGAAGSWGTGTITANSTGGIWYAPGSADAEFGSATGFMSRIQTASTGALSLPDTELATNFDFNAATISNASNMSIGVRGAKTYTGTVIPSGTFGYNWGHHLGTMTLNGNNRMTGVNAVTYKNGGAVIVTGTQNYTGVTNINGSNMSTAEQNFAAFGATAASNVFVPTVLQIDQLGDAGVDSALGNTSNAATNLLFNGGTLRYVGAATSTDRLFSVNSNGGTLESSGTGAMTIANTGTIALVVGTGNAATSRSFTLGGSYTGGTNTFAPILANSSHVGADLATYTDTLGVTKAGAGAWVLTGANTYTGLTSVIGGTLSFGGASVLPAGSNISVDGATSVLDLGAQTPTVGSATLTNGGTLIGTGSLNVTGTLYIGPGGSSTIPISGTGGINKIGTGTYTVTGDFSLSGICTISAGTLEVSSVANGGVNSPLGAGTNSATHLVFNGGALRYIGTGHSTDRLFTVNASSTIDASGSGPLQFTNTGANATTGTGGRTLTLTGTNTGANSIAGTLENGTGSLTVTKTGSGAWVLGGANTYTGGTNVTGGTLSFSGSGNIPTNTNVTVDGATAVLAMGALNCDVNNATLNNGGQILGSGNMNVSTMFYVNTGTNNLKLVGGGGLTKFGTGSYTLGTNHTYSGKTTVTGGTLAFAGATQQVIGGQDIEVNGADAVMNFGALNPVIGTATLTIGQILGTGSMTVNNTFNVAQGTMALPITGGGGLNKIGSTTYTMTNTNSYTGVTTVTAGTLVVNSLPNGGVNGPIGSSTNDAFNLVLNGGTLSYTGAGSTTDRLFSVSAASAINSSGSGALQFVNSGAILGGSTLTLAGTNTGANTIAGSLSSGMSIVKAGAGKWILSGANTYTGVTTVSAGTLQLNKDAHAPVLTGTGTTGAVVNTALVMDYSGGGVNPGASVQSILAATYASNADFSTGVIRSTAATGTRALGWKDSGSAVTILNTLDGDATLDGKVNTLDFNQLAGGFGAASQVWANGNFNYDANVDSLDFNLLAGTYGMAVALPSQPIGGASLGAVVPEPSMIGVLAALSLLPLRRRSR
jgi:autotransporter-associated beta strand protein